MIIIRRLLTSLATVLLLANCLRGQAGPPIFPVGDLRPGMKGIGRTIFQGDKIDEFQVEILGVLKNAIAPKRDLILARLSGGPLATTGVIAGMSGSPVYVDGKLIGAVSRSFPLAKEPIAGITPIEEMLTVVPSPGTTVAQGIPNERYRVFKVSGGDAELGRVIVDEDFGQPIPQNPAANKGVAYPTLLLPLRFGGFANAAIEQFTPQLRQLGLDPVQGGVISGSPTSTPPSSTDLEPGSMISLLLVRGDLDLNIDCTVTLRRGNSLYACGHQVLAEGPAAFPFAPAHVIVVIPNLASSFKVDAPGTVVGTIQQDRFDAIYGQVGGEAPPMIPVRLSLDSTLNRKSEYNFEMVQDSFLSPLLLNLAITSTLTATERSIGTSTMNVEAKIRLSDGQSVDLEDVLSGEVGTSTLVGTSVAAPLALLMSSGFPDLKVQDIDLSVTSLDEKRSASIEQVWSTKSEVRPGDHLEVTALLRLPSGATGTEKIPVDVPASVTDKILQLVVGGGSSINAMELRFSALGGVPRDAQQLVRALNRMRRNNRVYGLLMAPQRSFVMQGDEYPSPPPSLLQTFMADSGAASSVVFSGTSVVGDFETKPTPYAIRGQKTLTLRVVGAGT
ncbi:MAG TPA: SpoIVB peptidase S55 domain-containing protein [Terriglobia bacterium]|nr:SpoIVB peptidase S55 domain-containing protein [Terriglobia bacterium]